jgi:hypothetical protein
LIITSLLILIFTAAYTDGSDKLRYSSVEDLIDKGLLDASIRGMGGHEGECIVMLLANPTEDTSYVRIEPGRTLGSNDTTVQDILITREEVLALAPGEKRELAIYGFCGQASNASPDSAESFNIGKMADSLVVVLAEFLDERNNEFPEDAIQKAVWCLTDDHDIGEIYSEDLASIADLRNFVARLKGTDTFTLKVEDTPGRSNRFAYYTKTISGEIDLFVPTDCIVDIYLRDSKGNSYDSFKKKTPYKAGTYKYSYKFTVTNWPAGTYFLCVRVDGVLTHEKEFEL